MNGIHLTRAILIVFTVVLNVSCQGKKDVKVVNNGNTTEPRLGLLATQLGLNPVAGYESGDAPPAPPVGPSIPPQDYLPTGGAPAPPPEPIPAATGYSVDGIHGGNLISPSQCQCVPIEHCPYLNQGGQDDVITGSGGGAYGVGDGGSGGNIPVVGGGGDGNYGGGQQGGNYQGSGGLQGGNIPVIGGGNKGDSYGNQGQGQGQQGGNLPVDPNYGNGGGGSGSSPNTDGSGLLDLRIVNRPPRPGGVQCLNGQVFCCDLGNNNQNPGPGPGPSQGKPNYPGPGGSGGYVTCGSRNYIDVPGKQLEYGDAKFGAYPWMAVILGKGNNYVGAGALISPLYVLTAAHKIKGWKPGASMKVRLGEWNAKEDDEPYKNVEVDIESVLLHPQFNPQNLQNDLALVRLATPVDLKSYPHIKSVCLPQAGQPYTGKRCWVAGFGKDAFGHGKHSYIMKEVDLPILDSNDCENRLRSTRLGKYFELNRYSFICAGGEEGKDACTGDGGSPLVCENSQGGFEAVGLVAWGIGCADYGIPGVYVNVPNYVEWINQEIYRY